MTKPNALIIGVGDGLSAALARQLMTYHDLTLAARSGDKMRAVAEETVGQKSLLDATDEIAVASLFGGLPTTPRSSQDSCDRRLYRPLVDALGPKQPVCD